MTLYLQVKQGVDLTGLHPDITRMIWPIAEIFAGHKKHCVITSARRPRIGKNSWHQFGRALDFRANHLTPAEQARIYSDIREICGPQYDVILHGEGDNIHYHVEFDPD